MRLRIIAVAAIVAVLGVVAATASAGTSRQQANKLTVWLQVDAQSGWPDLVAAANQQFQSDHPGWTVDVQYQNWGDHLQKFDATIAGNTSPDVLEMGNTEMVKYMAAGAFADISSFKSNFANSANWLAGLAKSGQYGGKTYGVPYYAGSRVVTYRTDLYKKAGIKKTPTSLSQFIADAGKLASSNAKVKGFSPVYSAGTDWYFAMAFVYDFGGTIAKTKSGKWVGALDSKQSIAGLTAWKAFWNATSKASPTSDENNPAPYTVYSQGTAASIIGPGWFSCCVGTKYKTNTAQFVMPSHTANKPMPGFLGGSDLAVPAGSCEQGARCRLDQGLHQHEQREGPAGEGQHPERDEPARNERQRARSRAELVRARGQALGRRREREYPPQHALRDPHRKAVGGAGCTVGKREHHVGSEPELIP